MTDELQTKHSIQLQSNKEAGLTDTEKTQNKTRDNCIQYIHIYMQYTFLYIIVNLLLNVNINIHYYLYY